MYCRCSHCHTNFALTAAQLRAGRGRVRCGTCLTVFDALETLSDDLGELEPAVPPAAAVEEPAAPRDLARATDDLQAALAALPVTRATRDEPAPPADDDEDRRPQPALGDISRVAAAPEPVFEAREPAPEPATDPGAEAPPPAAGGEADAVPEVLREDMARLAASRRARRAAIGFGLGCLLLAGLAVVQYAWFEPTEVLVRYPQARSLMERFCEETGCVLPERRDASKVRMVTRDVRVHPRYEGALRVTASLMNTAPFPQPYPRLHFTLFNVNGQVIASRVFEPSEYLPEDVDTTQEMRPRVPVQVALELLAPEDAAVSFEFDFL